MKIIKILHPFTPQAAGVVEKSVTTYHSQPHAKAMIDLTQRGYNCSMEYFTPRLLKYTLLASGLNYTFFPVDFKINGDHKKWKKQFSKSCLKTYDKDTPDVTIINMSGHSSLFSYELSKLILKKNKNYIAMLGGRHYNSNPWLKDYYKKAHHILVHTELQKKEMLSLNIFEGLDIRVLPLGVDTEVFNLNKKGSNTINLIYIGRIVELKRIHLAIDVLLFMMKQGLKNIKLRIVGPIYSHQYQKELEQLVRENNMEDQVLFEGFKEHSELPNYFSEADLFLLPSESESFGMVVVESMSCGVPVAVIKGVGGPEDIISDGLDGIVAPVDSYAASIYNLLTDKDKLKEMKYKARQKVLAKYSIQETTRVLLQSVNDALQL